MEKTLSLFYHILAYFTTKILLFNLTLNLTKFNNKKYLTFIEEIKGGSLEDYIYQVQRNIILDIAEQGNCVIVGRCADFILKDRDNVLNIFIHGTKEMKCQRIKDLYEKTEKDALLLMRDTDKKRSLNYSYYTDQTWGAVKNYALCLNSGILGYEKCIEIIKDIVRSSN